MQNKEDFLKIIKYMTTLSGLYDILEKTKILFI